MPWVGADVCSGKAGGHKKRTHNTIKTLQNNGHIKLIFFYFILDWSNGGVFGGMTCILFQ